MGQFLLFGKGSFVLTFFFSFFHHLCVKVILANKLESLGKDFKKDLE